ncbi:MAG: cell division protein FtsK, partial [Kiritimatiellae bacterium]|nr:cell division protein FtsK [Kiritimatiellia bacterium]
MVIIDEFQMLFEDDPQLGREIERGLTKLFRQGRSYGIHVILLTQTLKGIQAMSMSQLISQIGCRIALACTEEDSAQILSSNNWAASELHSPPEAIINNARGAKSANVKFNVPLADDEFCAGNMKLLDTLCGVRGISNDPKIFNGDSLPIIPTMAYFKSHLATSEFLIGQTLSLNSEELRINIAETPKTNILIAGAHRRLRRGLFASILRSTISGGTFDEVLVVNGSGAPLSPKDTESIKECDRAINVLEPSGVNWEELANGLGLQKRAILMLSFERIKDLQNQGSLPRIGQTNAKSTAAQLFKAIVEEGPRQGTCVVAFVDVWKRCNVQGNKETL